MLQLRISIVLFYILLFGNLVAQETSWPQFRGHNSSGHADENCQPPIEFGVDKNLLWKVELPVGHSSPCIWDVMKNKIPELYKQIIGVIENHKD